MGGRGVWVVAAMWDPGAMSWSRGRGHGAGVEGMGAMGGGPAKRMRCGWWEPWSHEPWVPGCRGHGGHAMDMGMGGGESGEGGAGGHAPAPFKVI